MSETQAGTAEARSDEALFSSAGHSGPSIRGGSGKHRGRAAGQEESGQDTQGRHRRSRPESEPGSTP